MIALDNYCTRHLGKTAALFLLVVFCPTLWPQAVPPTPATAEVPPEPPKDPLGRDTPRKAVLGFLDAARKGNAEVAVLYLNTPPGTSSETLARQLAIVLDRRLPARLNEISDKPEGSVQNPLKPDEDLIGTISTESGDLDIVLERVDRGGNGKVWLFSKKTLALIPDVFKEVNTPPIDQILPQFMVRTRVANIPLFEWLAFFAGLPLLYLLTGVLDLIISRGSNILRRRSGRSADLPNRRVLRAPARLLLIALAIRSLLSMVALPLLARQFWSTTALMITILAGIWLSILLNSWGERYLVRRVRSLSGSASILRLFRRLIDGIVLFAGLLLTLHYFDVNVTAALAGLGVGGIAIALAAQKTLENVIAGVSLIADRALHVGDLVNVGDIQGTVEEVGLRSTRIRTLDRTVASLPNGQIANMRLETLSARDKFWFHPVIGLRYGTEPDQIQSVVTGIRKLLSEQDSVASLSIRVRFIRFGTSSLDVDISAYVLTRDVNEFLEIQEDLLLGIMAIVEKTGTEIASPSQTVYLAGETSAKPNQLIRSQTTRS
jgi:MscS family membrane protein